MKFQHFCFSLQCFLFTFTLINIKQPWLLIIVAIVTVQTSRGVFLMAPLIGRILPEVCSKVNDSNDKLLPYFLALLQFDWMWHLKLFQVQHR